MFSRYLFYFFGMLRLQKTQGQDFIVKLFILFIGIPLSLFASISIENAWYSVEKQNDTLKASTAV
ncbi:hypothetical protein C9926_02580 [Sulfurovum lithotrophicum]|nr:hypothetical protein C9926_02580 [Sulfurovum lithotrophicum]